MPIEQVNGTDDLATITSLGLLAYLAADVAHHLLGHAAACKLSGGKVILITSQVVQCTNTGAAEDLAGPAASLCVGVLTYLASRLLRGLSPTQRLLLSLIAAGGYLLDSGNPKL
jgi:hypothetical protein